MPRARALCDEHGAALGRRRVGRPLRRRASCESCARRRARRCASSGSAAPRWRRRASSSSCTSARSRSAGWSRCCRDLPRVVSRLAAHGARAARERARTWWCWSTRRTSTCPFARRARRLGIPTLYYVSPQVWAWRARPHPQDRAPRGPARGDLPVRAGGLRRDAACRVEFVGHPLVERLAPLAAARDRAAARRALGLAAERAARGAPAREPAQRAAPRAAAPARGGARAARARPAHPLRRAVAPPRSRARRSTQAHRARARLPALLDLAVIEGRTHERAARGRRRARASPAPSTLEVALLGTPAGRGGAHATALTAWLIAAPGARRVAARCRT